MLHLVHFIYYNYKFLSLQLIVYQTECRIQSPSVWLRIMKFIYIELYFNICIDMLPPKTEILPQTLQCCPKHCNVDFKHCNVDFKNCNVDFKHCNIAPNTAMLTLNTSMLSQILQYCYGMMQYRQHKCCCYLFTGFIKGTFYSLLWLPSKHIK